MATAFDNQVQYWIDRVRSGPVGEFLRWWSGELRQVMPPAWRQRLQMATRRLTVRLDAGLIQLGVEESAAISVIEDIPLGEDLGLQRQHIATLLEEQALTAIPRWLLIDVAQVLRKEIGLPIAAEANLQQVLTFEMDRQTPFRAADVYFAWRVLRGGKESGQLRVELLVSPRPPVDRAIEALATRGLAPSGVDIITGGRTMGVNVLPPEQRHRVVNPQSRLNLGLAAGLVLLLMFVMVQSLNVRSNRAAALEAAIAEVQDDARRVQRLREQLLENSDAAGFLVRRRAGTPMAIEIMTDVTRTLPDDTYLDRLVIDHNSILMQGKSRNAQQLIEVVNKSEMLENAAFRGSTRLDAATGLEIFEVSADISPLAES